MERKELKDTLKNSKRTIKLKKQGELADASIMNEESNIKKEITLYYHNFTEDKKTYDWISFNEEFVLPIKRNIPISRTPIRDVFTLLFEANLTDDEVNNGFVAGVFETYDFSIRSITLNNGVLKIDFMSQNFTLESLSSAESSIFVNSVRKTALQFPEIEKIQFPNEMYIGVRNPNDTQM